MSAPTITGPAGTGVEPAAGRTRGMRWPLAAMLLAAALIASVAGSWGTLGRAGLSLDPVSRFLTALAVIVVACYLLGSLAQRLRQPRVIGEVVGGLLLGPSALGTVWHAGYGFLFAGPVLPALQMTAQLGLVVFLFLLGSELRLTEVRAARATVGTVVLCAMGLPTLAGIGLAMSPVGSPADGGHGHLAYAVFLGLCLGVTALPVLARLLVDLGMAGGRLGTLALACAAAGDVLMWAAVTALLTVNGSHSHRDVLAALAIAVALVGVIAVLVRPALRELVRRADRSGETALLLPVLVVGASSVAVVTSLIGLHPAIGAFLFGTVMPRESAALDRVHRQLSGFAVSVLLPVFFVANIGLVTEVGLLGRSAANWWFLAAALAVACGTKFAGTTIGARATGLRGPESRQLAALMNCRGVTELILASIGLQYGLINRLGFTVLVLVALVTTAMTGPLVRAFAPRKER